MVDMDLEAQNFRNLVDFYADELREILRGTIARALLSQAERSNLREHGVLCEGFQYRGRVLAVTAEAQALLEGVLVHPHKRGVPDEWCSSKYTNIFLITYWWLLLLPSFSETAISSSSGP